MSQAPLVMITGASSGIGLALAHACLQQGWRVALVARRRDVLEREQLERAWDPALVRLWSADVCDTQAMQAVAQACIAEWGLPDVVIANAGISLGVDLAEAEDLPVFAQVMQTNVQGLVNTFQPFMAPCVHVAVDSWWASPAWPVCGGCQGMPPTVRARQRSSAAARACEASWRPMTCM